MVHTAVVLPPDMIDRLKKGERGLSEAIRERLKQSLDADRYDQRTRDLADDVMKLADQVRAHTSLPWHANHQTRKVLETALQAYLAVINPPLLGAEADLGPDDAPTLGRAIARNYYMQKALAAGPLTLSSEDAERMTREVQKRLADIKEKP